MRLRMINPTPVFVGRIGGGRTMLFKAHILIAPLINQKNATALNALIMLVCNAMLKRGTKPP